MAAAGTQCGSGRLYADWWRPTSGAVLARRKSSVTTRLYYEDSHLTSFDAVVLRVASRGDRQAVWLDRSAFYPTTGGQPFDTGALDTAHVVDVVEDDNGDVLHVLEGEPLRVGQAVRGVVDWTRRFDHMQQHSGQHVLSAAIARLFGVPTVSFHLGAEASTIDLARELSAGESTARRPKRTAWSGTIGR